MSRSGYSDDGTDVAMWRGQVASAIRGKRGQAFLRELIEALDAMPVKRLIAEELRQDGEVCALGCIGARRGLDLESMNPYAYNTLAGVFNIAHQLVQELEFENDEQLYNPTPERRWQHVRDWAARHISLPRVGGG